MELRKRQVILTCLILLCIFIFWWMSDYNETAYQLHAEQGVLDLTEQVWTPPTKYLLGGEWELYEGVLLTPEEIMQSTADKVYLTEKYDSISPRVYQRTYRLKLILDTPEQLALLIPDMKAFKLWINGDIVMNYRFDEASQRILRMNTIELDSEMYETIGQGYELDIVMQTLNRISHRERPGKIFIGTPGALYRVENVNLLLNTIAIGIYFLIVVFSFSLFKNKRSETYLLYLGLLGINNAIAHFLDSNISSVTNIYLEAEVWKNLILLAVPLNLILIFMLCSTLFYGSKIKRWHGLFFITATVCAILFAFVPLQTIGIHGNLNLYLGRILAPLNAVIIVKAYLDSRTNSLLLAGALAFFITFVFETSVNTGLLAVGALNVYINTSFYGYLLFTIMIVLTVGNKFAKKFEEADQMTLKLEYINEHLEQLVDEKTERLKQSYAENIEIQQRKHTMLLNISHDLRTPLFIIKGYIDAIVEGIVKERKDELQYLKRTQSKLNYLSRLISDLFLVARLEDNKVEFMKTTFNLSLLILQIIKDLEIKAAAKRITVSFLPDTAEAFINADKDRLQQVLENIIDNALKYTGDNGHIQIGLSHKSNNIIQIIVQDNGIGIPETDLPHIFEQYYKRTKTATSDESTGLGLFIAREIIEKHDGTIHIHSQLGQGTQVTILLPESCNI